MHLFGGSNGIQGGLGDMNTHQKMWRGGLEILPWEIVYIFALKQLVFKPFGDGFKHSFSKMFSYLYIQIVDNNKVYTIKIFLNQRKYNHIMYLCFFEFLE